MTDSKKLNNRGNHEGEFSQSVGGWAEYTVTMTKTEDIVRHDIKVPPGKVIPIIFLPGVMGSNLRMSKKRQEDLDRPDNRSWRPDDLLDKTGKAAIVTGEGFGGWLKNATPKERQLIFDPGQTEVEYYHYTSNKDRFDSDGAETIAADARHQNVPDSLAPIPPLMQRRFDRSPSGKLIPKETPAQIARWRGWSEVLFTGSYGKMLITAETYLNNMLYKNQVHQIWKEVMVDPKNFGAESGEAISESDIRSVSACWYPVHAMGYNFLMSNGKSAVVIADRIRGLVEGYKSRGFDCTEVIILTHSMGGLLGRALLHESYGNLLNDKKVKVLGMYHNVMPTTGAASAYKRMRFGFKESYGYFARVEASVLAVNGKHATAILANAPAPLELLPGSAYGQDWLKVVDPHGRTMWSWPRGNTTALESIYLQPEDAWWRLVNPLWVNPADIPEDQGGGMINVLERLERAFTFVNSIEQTFHPTQCYASYCASSEQRAYGDVVFKSAETWQPFSNRIPGPLPDPTTWKLLTDDARGQLTVKAGKKTFVLQLQSPTADGDQTVPSDRSACKVKGQIFVHGNISNDGYEHQASYSDPQVLKSMLYSIINIAKFADWKKHEK